MEFVMDKQLVLKQIEMGHAEELFELTDRNREHLRAWLPWIDSTVTLADSKHFIAASQFHLDQQMGMEMGIFYKGKLCGMIGLHGGHWTNCSINIGYWLAEEAQGKGLITRACSEMIDYVFSKRQLNRIEIRAAVGNVKSRAVIERLGFTEEGTARQAEWLNDKFVDLVVYSMLAREWQVGKGTVR